jgi:hypothetical protein
VDGNEKETRGRDVIRKDERDCEVILCKVVVPYLYNRNSLLEVFV